MTVPYEDNSRNAWCGLIRIFTFLNYLIQLLCYCFLSLIITFLSIQQTHLCLTLCVIYTLKF